MHPRSYWIGAVVVLLLACASAARADINVVTWQLNTESCNNCSSARQTTVSIPSFQAEDAVDNTFGTAGATTAYDFEVVDESCSFGFVFDGWIDESPPIESAGDLRLVRSVGSMFFRVSPDTDLRYLLDGVYALDGDSERFSYRVQLTDLSTGTNLFYNNQESMLASGGTLELGQTAGNAANILAGNLAGTLTAGHNYYFNYSVVTSSRANVPGASTSSGDLSLHISLGTTCGNGVAEDGEDCDGGECCTPDCTFAEAGTPCGDAAETDCDGADVCDGFGVCDANTADDGTSCDDGDDCSTVDACVAGVCVGGPDETDPTIACSADVVAEPAGPDGANVSYKAPIPDDNCADVTTVCVPASGDLFAIGDTSVACEATDGAGNVTECSFIVTVLSAEEVVEDLIDAVHALAGSGAFNQGQARSLIAKLKNALDRLAAGNTRAGCNVLGAFVNSVYAMVNSGKLAPEEALPLLESAMAARAALGCDVADNGSVLKLAPKGRR